MDFSMAMSFFEKSGSRHFCVYPAQALLLRE
jgi:hypothetical protein